MCYGGYSRSEIAEPGKQPSSTTGASSTVLSIARNIGNSFLQEAYVNIKETAATQTPETCTSVKHHHDTCNLTLVHATIAAGGNDGSSSLMAALRNGYLGGDHTSSSLSCAPKIAGCS